LLIAFYITELSGVYYRNWQRIGWTVGLLDPAVSLPSFTHLSNQQLPRSEVFLYQHS